MSTNPKKLADVELTRMLLTFNLLSRQLAIQEQNIDPTGRNLDRDCGYPEGVIGLPAYRSMYDRWGIASRVVQVYPDECFASEPEVYEDENPNKTTRFERAWLDILERHHLWHYVHRADVESGIGSFGGLLLGFGGQLDQPVPGIEDYLVNGGSPGNSPLLYLRPLSEDYITIDEYEKNESSPRFGLPVWYNITTGFSSTKTSDQPSSLVQITSEPEHQRQRVHWTRFVHMADNCESSNVFGTPRMQRVYNYLFDIRKIGGGSAEMFWQGAFPGWAFEVFKELADSVTLDRDSIAEEVKKYRDRLQRVLTSNAGTWKSLAPQIADPSKHLEQQLQLLCASIGVPLRVFLGSEAAHLASTQDIQTWNRRLNRRQANYLTPMVIRPVVDRLIAAGALPRPKRYYVSWKDLNTLTDTDKADRSVKLSQAILQYVTSGAFKLIKPTSFFVSVLQMTPEEAKSIVAESGGESAILSALDEMVEANAKNAATGDPAARTGASGKRNGAGS